MMTNSLKEELKKFWNWAGISPEEYSEGKIPEHARQTEWEDDYPEWIELEKSFKKALKQYKNTLTPNILKYILELVGLDNESGTVVDILIHELNDIQKLDFTNLGYQFAMPQTRWQIAEFLKESNVPNRVDFLESMISADKDKYVQRRALLSLAEIDPKRACVHAYQKLTDEDEYLRLVSIRILKEENSSRLPEALSILKDDPSNLVQEEIKV